MRKRSQIRRSRAIATFFTIQAKPISCLLIGNREGAGQAGRTVRRQKYYPPKRRFSGWRFFFGCWRQAKCIRSAGCSYCAGRGLSCRSKRARMTDHLLPLLCVRDCSVNHSIEDCSVKPARRERPCHYTAKLSRQLLPDVPLQLGLYKLYLC